MTAAGLSVIGYLLYAEVLLENEYLSGTLEVQEGLKAVGAGLYGVVSHPMYLSSILVFLSMPVLGSLLVVFLCTCDHGQGIENEEKVLERGLPDYVECKKRLNVAHREIDLAHPRGTAVQQALPTKSVRGSPTSWRVASRAPSAIFTAT